MNGATRRIFLDVAALLLVPLAALNAASPLDWPPITRETKPWAYNWWLGSAVDRANLTKELTRYRDAGLGGIHIIPIYGARGWEDKYIDYLSPRWMQMLHHTVTEADRLGLGVDMTTGTGWCFGGPNVSEYDANITTKDGCTTKATMRVKRRPRRRRLDAQSVLRRGRASLPPTFHRRLRPVRGPKTESDVPRLLRV